MNGRGSADELTDLLVVGASFAGVACAIEAARAGLRVVLIEREHDAGEKLHTTGIVVKEAADELGLLGDLPPELILPIRGVRPYGSRLNSVALDSPGYVLPGNGHPESNVVVDFTGERRGRRRASWDAGLCRHRRGRICCGASNAVPESSAAPHSFGQAFAETGLRFVNVTYFSHLPAASFWRNQISDFRES